MINFILLVLLACSASLNAYFAFRSVREKKTAPPTRDARAILADIVNGTALIRIDRVDPADVFLRSPRDL